MESEPGQSPNPNIPREIYLTEEQLAIKALVDSLDDLMPWVFERREE